MTREKYEVGRASLVLRLRANDRESLSKVKIIIIVTCLFEVRHP